MGVIRRQLAVVLTIASVGAGCSTEQAIPRSEYVARVNGLCAATARQIDAALIPIIEDYVRGLGTAVPDEGDLTDEQVMGLYAATKPVAEEMSEVFSSMLAEIRSLPAPDADAAAFTEHWDEVERLWNEAHEAIGIAASDPIAARALLAEPDPRLSPTNEAALALDIEECVFD